MTNDELLRDALRPARALVTAARIGCEEEATAAPAVAAAIDEVFEFIAGPRGGNGREKRDAATKALVLILATMVHGACWALADPIDDERRSAGEWVDYLVREVEAGLGG